MRYLLPFLMKFLRLPVLQQFTLSVLIPWCGIIFFHWLAGAVLFYFMLELANYWLCNLVLLLCFAKAPSTKERWKQAGIFTFWNWISLVGFYLFVAWMTDPKSPSMATNVTRSQALIATLIYWAQFAWFLYSTKPKNKMTQEVVIKEVSYRLIGIYMTIYCIIGYFFVFWMDSEVMNYALAIVLVFAKNLADLVLIAVKMGNERAKAK